MMTDTIADMLTRIRNAQMAKLTRVEMPFSKVKFAIAEILKKEQYVGKVEKIEGTPSSVLSIELLYHSKQPAIQSIKRESKPGHRVYKGFGQLPKVLNGFGISIVSTSQGIMTAREAKEKGVGGEIICSVY
ncbi:MAG: 30S ribosomal protein S8 [Candidatus Magasanikbacteria bacterium]|nr:30S ribosomal protein S8 [Candidatus Magasanikbacteria bacterium]